MKRVTIRLSESAVADLEEIRRWYADQGVPEVGDRLIRKIIQRIEWLEMHPEMGRMVPEFGQPFLRELIEPPFRIVYRHEQNQVQIVRVWRSERVLHLSEDS